LILQHANAAVSLLITSARGSATFACLTQVYMLNPFFFVNNNATHFGHVFLADIKPSLLAIIGTADEAYGIVHVHCIDML
jgi:hypothetical protein